MPPSREDTLLVPHCARCASTEDHQPPSPLTVAIYRNLHPRGCGTLPLPDVLRAHRPGGCTYPLDSTSKTQSTALFPDDPFLARPMQALMAVPKY